MNFNERINQSELMDTQKLDQDHLRQVFSDINRSNELLGGNKISLNTISSIQRKLRWQKFSILDVGCGDGVLLRQLADYFAPRGIEVALVGLDNNKDAIDIAEDLSANYPNITYYCSDILENNNQIPKCDLLISSLTMHHLSNLEIPHYLNRCRELAMKTIIINDLERSKLAYYLFKIFSLIFIKSAIAKEDGLTSIRKGFTKKELESFSEFMSDWKHSISWKWAFRYVWVMDRNRL